MSCPSGETWTAYADDEAPRAERQELEAHLASCPDCRSLVLALREENRLLARAVNPVLLFGEIERQPPVLAGRNPVGTGRRLPVAHAGGIRLQQAAGGKDAVLHLVQTVLVIGGCHGTLEGALRAMADQHEPG